MVWKYCSSSQHTVILSASSRSRGDGFSPAISFLMALRLRGIASWVNTSSPDRFFTMLRSTFLARSMIRATLGTSSSTCRSSGRALSSPSCPVYQVHELLCVRSQLRRAVTVALGLANGFLWAHAFSSILPCCAGDTRRRARPPGPEVPKPPKVPPQELLGRRALLALPSTVPPVPPCVRVPGRPFGRPAL